MTGQPHPFGVASGVESGFLYWCFSFRICPFQIALACSSEPLNGFSVPRDLRYAAFVILDIVHLEMDGTVLSESRLQLSSELPALLSMCYLQSWSK